MGYCRILTLFTALVLVSGCGSALSLIGLGEKKKDRTFEDAVNDDLPSTLADKETLKEKADKVEKEVYVLSPLQKQLKQLSEEAARQRKMLYESQKKADEYKQTAQDMRGSLAQMEQKIERVKTVIKMIDGNSGIVPDSNINNMPMAGDNMACAATEKVQGIKAADFSEEAMPSLGADSVLKGGPNPSFNETPANNETPAKLPRNEWNFGNAGKPEAKAPAGSPGLAPLDEDVALLNTESGPELDTGASGVWNDSVGAEKKAAPKKADAKIIVCQELNGEANIIINKGSNDSVTEGMLYKDGNGNVLVVTRVYRANAEARVHPRHDKGGLKTGLELTRMNQLP